MLDLVEPRENLRGSLRKLLELHALAGDGLSASGLPQPDELDVVGEPPITDPAQLEERRAWDVVQLARHIERPNTLEYLAAASSTTSRSCTATGSSTRTRRSWAGSRGSASSRCSSSATQKGHTTSEMIERNFGMPNPEGYRKGLRLMRHAARFGMPIVTFVDTPGAYPGLGAEERGQSIAIAQSIMEMSRLPVPIVTIVTGEGGSGGALALAVGDRVLMLENSYYSVISPEGCSTILFKDAAQAPRAAEALRLTAPRPAAPRRHGRGRAGARRRRAHESGSGGREPQGGHRRQPAGAARRAAGGAARASLRPLPRLRHARPAIRPRPNRRELNDRSEMPARTGS